MTVGGPAEAVELVPFCPLAGLPSDPDLLKSDVEIRMEPDRSLGVRPVSPGEEERFGDDADICLLLVWGMLLNSDICLTMDEIRDRISERNTN